MAAYGLSIFHIRHNKEVRGVSDKIEPIEPTDISPVDIVDEMKIELPRLCHVA